jgi:hypothetical protein
MFLVEERTWHDDTTILCCLQSKESGAKKIDVELKKKTHMKEKM